MTEITHSKYCQAQQAAVAAWKAQWPDHCPDCMGEGGHVIRQTRWEPEDYQVCHCVEEGHCPRCKSDLDFSDKTDVSVCPVCFWTDAWVVNGEPNDDIFSCPDDSCDCWDRPIPEDAHLESYYEMQNGEGFEDAYLGDCDPVQEDF